MTKDVFRHFHLLLAPTENMWSRRRRYCRSLWSCGSQFWRRARTQPWKNQPPGSSRQHPSPRSPWGQMGQSSQEAPLRTTSHLSSPPSSGRASLELFSILTSPPQHNSLSSPSTSGSAFPGWGHRVCGRCQRYFKSASPSCQKCWSDEQWY